MQDSQFVSSVFLSEITSYNFANQIVAFLRKLFSTRYAREKNVNDSFFATFEPTKKSASTWSQNKRSLEHAGDPPGPAELAVEALDLRLRVVAEARALPALHLRDPRAEPLHLRRPTASFLARINAK